MSGIIAVKETNLFVVGEVDGERTLELHPPDGGVVTSFGPVDGTANHLVEWISNGKTYDATVQVERR